ncbi:hypothetical protein BGZ60DRAFT_534311 [Tricladium varicosporioides]|nr:hypothetical protein BGZ60DRAFT_534311 [Hymenoscyphus varicosporioides]
MYTNNNEKVVDTTNVEHIKKSQHIDSNEIFRDVDAATKALKDQDLTYTEGENKRFLRKVDLWLMPLTAFPYRLQLVDKSTPGVAATYGIRKPLNSRDRRTPGVSPLVASTLS